MQNDREEKEWREQEYDSFKDAMRRLDACSTNMNQAPGTPNTFKVADVNLSTSHHDWHNHYAVHIPAQSSRCPYKQLATPIAIIVQQHTRSQIRPPARRRLPDFAQMLAMLLDNLRLRLLDLALAQSVRVPCLETILLCGRRVAYTLCAMGLEHHGFERASEIGRAHV